MSGGSDSDSSDRPQAPAHTGRTAKERPDQPISGIREFLASVTSVGSTGGIYHPIFDKFESGHVTQFLDHAHKHEIDDSRFRSKGRWFRLGYVVIGVAVFVFLTVFLLPAQPSMYFGILKGVGIFSAGVAGGYGIKTYQSSTRE